MSDDHGNDWVVFTTQSGLRCLRCNYCGCTRTIGTPIRVDEFLAFLSEFLAEHEHREDLE